MSAATSLDTVRDTLRHRLSVERRRELGGEEPRCPHVRVRWTNGPTVATVAATCSLFHGAEFHPALGRWMAQESLLALPPRDGHEPIPVLVQYDAGSARLHRSLSRGYRDDLLRCASAFGFHGTGGLLSTPWGLAVDHPAVVAELLSTLLSRRAARDGAQLVDSIARRDFVLAATGLSR
ncbi:hypothetical protein [Kineococcus radiotolerans]|uniref:hypothetical protein n=1 Tax=Kineococcus radiotolerans TaxID=131568 RepID=UPI0012FF17B3|nr:hypothetical protein [Kineococcus radiotolerans]